MAHSVPARVLGTCVTSRDAHWVCSGKVNDGGFILDQGLTGDAQNNENCTGTITYTQTLTGFPVSLLTIDYVILDGGDTIKGLPLNSGGVLSCSLNRLSNDGHD